MDNVNINLFNVSKYAFDDVAIDWRNISYSIVKNTWSVSFTHGITRTKVTKDILKTQSGYIKSGHLVAVLGPSGAGKSSLLECLTGRKRRGLKGDININQIGIQEMKHKPKISFIPQRDHLLEVFTVKETLLFASKLKNYDIPSWLTENDQKLNYHQNVVDKVLKDLSLDTCADVKVSKCSGGQIKRLSFAVELVSKSEIIFLDEPTTGLDSTSILQCIKLFKQLTSSILEEKRIVKRAIILTIHQPSFTLMNFFDQLYILSHNGKCIYQGSPQNLINYFTRFGLKCPPFHNPADFAIEISSGIHGKYALDELEKAAHKESELSNPSYYISDKNRLPVTEVIDDITRQDRPILYHTWILLLRTWIHSYREPQLLWFRLLQHILVAFALSLIYTQEIGKEDGCFDNIQLDQIISMDYQRKYMKKIQLAIDNSGFLFFCIAFALAASITTTVLTFPLEILVFFKERSNGWYNCSTYYVAKLFADLPFQITMTIMFASVVYPLSHQIPEFWRFSIFSKIK